ncbi:hypothetical protein E2320_007172 [Naja naja]|nr:hypothetical protein E2320_007172 [Naja naja]
MEQNGKERKEKKKKEKEKKRKKEEGKERRKEENGKKERREGGKKGKGREEGKIKERKGKERRKERRKQKKEQSARLEFADRRYRLTPEVDLKLFEPTRAVSADLHVQPDLVCPDLPCHALVAVSLKCHSSPNVTLHQLSNTKINLCNQHSINADGNYRPRQNGAPGKPKWTGQMFKSIDRRLKGRGGDLIHVIAKGVVVGIGGGSFPAPY